MAEQTPEKILNQHFNTEELEYVAGLYNEGLDNPDEELREQHLSEVAELVGDFAVYEALSLKVASDRHVTESWAEEFKAIRVNRAAYKIEAEGWAKEAPRFSDQLLDTGRTAPFTFNRLPKGVDPEGWPQEQATESEGLVELADFLSDYIERNDSVAGGNQQAAQRAKSMQENLTFIGQPEYQEAVQGLAANWKNYLRVDPQRKICLLTEISDSNKYPGQRKSDEYLRDQIFQTFSDEELQEFSGRIVNDLEDIQEDSPRDTRLILLDDWTISGTQMRRVYQELTHDPYFEPFKDSLEINVLTASEGRITNGLEADFGDPLQPAIPVKAYYKSHHAEEAKTENKGYVSGLHSSVNYDFEDILEDMAYEDTEEGQMPRILALSSIVRPYHNQEATMEVSARQLKRVR